MIDLNFKLAKKFNVDLAMIYFYRPFFDGIDFFEFHIILDNYEDDHKPSFTIWISILNFCLLDFEIYGAHRLKNRSR